MAMSASELAILVTRAVAPSRLDGRTSKIADL
jgi:hypothetical protein